MGFSRGTELVRHAAYVTGAYHAPVTMEAGDPGEPGVSFSLSQRLVAKVLGSEGPRARIFRVPGRKRWRSQSKERESLLSSASVLLRPLDWMMSIHTGRVGLLFLVY